MAHEAYNNYVELQNKLRDARNEEAQARAEVNNCQAQLDYWKQDTHDPAHSIPLIKINHVIKNQQAVTEARKKLNDAQSRLEQASSNVQSIEAQIRMFEKIFCN